MPPEADDFALGSLPVIGQSLQSLGGQLLVALLQADPQPDLTVLLARQRNPAGCLLHFLITVWRRLTAGRALGRWPAADAESEWPVEYEALSGEIGRAHV